MNTMKQSFYAAMVMMMLAAFGVTTQAQRQPSRVSDQQVQNVLRRLETDTDRYRESLDEGLDRSRYDGSRTEDDIVSFVPPKASSKSSIGVAALARSPFVSMACACPLGVMPTKSSLPA